MGQNGTIEFYQCWGGRGSLRHRFQKLVDLAGATKVVFSTHSPIPFKQDGGFIRVGTGDSATRITVEQVLAHRRGFGTISALLSVDYENHWTWHKRLMDEIPSEIAGRFYPGEPTITMGWHTIDDLPLPDFGPDPTKRHLARFSLSLFGYGCPNNWEEYRKRVFDTEAMRELEARLIDAIGPVKRAISWSV
ncbi:MAG: hypothetical protein HRU13_00465 [Phycisphaerales bacterium]|nr:hypothetical protein [Phycisphaerales bacterium]